MSVRFNTLEYSSVSGKRPPTQFPGYYEVRKMTIGGVDVLPQMVQFDIYEDLSAQTMSGSISILDTTNLIRRIPIIGEEEVHIQVTDQVDEVNLKFMVYKVTDRMQVNFGVLSYTVHFVSRERYYSEFTRVSKAYDQTFYEDAVLDVLSNYLGSSKELLFGPSKHKQCFILPNWNCLQAISWMASRTVDSDPRYSPGNYVFFEEKDRFNFISLENLFDDSMNKVFSKVTLDPLRPTVDKRHTYDGRMPDDTLRFEQYRVSKSFDVLDNSSGGMYQNWLKLVDITDRDALDFKFDYRTDFPKSQHLKGALGEAFPLSSPQHQALHNIMDTEYRVAVRHRGLFTNEPDGGYHLDEWYLPRMSQMQQMENFKIEGVLPGQLAMKVGMLLYFDFPNTENISASVAPPRDLYYSGNYLITALRRTFQKDKFWCTVEMVKDSLSLSLDLKET